MSTSKRSSLQKRHKTRHRGITFRTCKDKTRTYSVTWQGSYIKVVGGEDEALALQAELRSAKARGEKTTAPSKRLFEDVAERYFEWKAPRLRSNTVKEYRFALDKIHIPEFEGRKIASITTDDISGLLYKLDARFKPSTVQTYLRPLYGVLKYAVKEKLIPFNPATQLTEDDRPHRPDDAEADISEHYIWSDEKMKALVAAAERRAMQPTARYDYSPLLRTTLQTGLRESEVLGLRWRDIDLTEGELHVRWQWVRGATDYTALKTKAARRTIPLAPDLVQYLREYKIRCDYSQDEHPVFATRKTKNPKKLDRGGKPLQHRNVTGRGLEPVRKDAGIEDVSFHDLRHGYASKLIWEGISSTELARLLGHKSAKMTEEIYVHEYNRVQTHAKVKAAASWE